MEVPSATKFIRESSLHKLYLLLEYQHKVIANVIAVLKI